MDRGVYAAASGGLTNFRLLQIVGNNLANVSTVGFKAERLITRQQEFEDTLAGALNDPSGRAAADHERTPGTVDMQTTTDFTPGPVSFTGDPLNVALRQSNQFFVVNTPEGEAYTRAGNFTLDSAGQLVTPDGFPVMGDGGAIALRPGTAKITGTGMVMVDKEQVGRLRVVQVDDPTQLQRKSGVRFSLGANAQPNSAEADLITESVEMPNVSVVQSMVDMINVQRAFETYTKSVRTINELDDVSLRTARSIG